MNNKNLKLKREQNLIKFLLELDVLGTESILIPIIENEQKFSELSELLTSSLKKIGDLWEQGKTSVAQIYMIGRILDRILAKYYPLPENSELENELAICVLEDNHMLGARILLKYFNIYRLKVDYLGHGLSVEELINILIKKNYKVLFISVLMLPAALRVKELIDLMKKKKIKTEIVVGGAPFCFDENLWKEVGANAMGKVPMDGINYLKKNHPEYFKK